MTTKPLYKLGWSRDLEAGDDRHRVWCAYFPADSDVAADRVDLDDVLTTDAIDAWIADWVAQAAQDGAEVLVAPGLRYFRAQVEREGPPGLGYCLTCDGWYPKNEVLDNLCDHCRPEVFDGH